MSRILLVDDDPNIRRLMMYLLRQQGHEVHTTDNGRDALRLLKHFSPQLLVTDLLMPRMPGLELINMVRHNLPDLPIIVVSAYSHYTRDALAAEGVYQIKKPFSQQDFVTVVNQAVNALH